MNKILSSLGLAVLGIAILVGAATAGTSGTTGIGASVSNMYSITAPGAVSGWALTTIGANNYDTSANSVTMGTVSSNCGWKVQVSENSGDGQLESSGTAGDKIAAALHASSDGFTSSDVTVSITPTTIATGSATASANLDIDYRQTVVYSDKVHNDYAMTLTYAISSSS